MNFVLRPNDSRQKEHEDSETKKLLEAHLQLYIVTDSTWVSTDRHQNNLLHVIARTAEVGTLAWILQLHFAKSNNRLVISKKRRR